MADPSMRDLLSILLEAGEENVPTILNTFQARHPAATPNALLAGVGQLLGDAEAQGYTQFAWYRNGWVPLAAEERPMIEPLSNGVVWNTKERQWRWKEEEFRPERPIAILTSAGEQHIRRLLRG